MHPVATCFGNAEVGLGFYHIDVPSANKTNWLNFENCGVLNVLKGEPHKEEVVKCLNVVFYKSKKWPWKVRELSSKIFLIRFPLWKKAEDRIEFLAFDFKDGVNFKITEWK